MTRATANDVKSSFTITDLASEFGITTRTIRFYEDHGLLSPARKGRNRVYGKRDVVRLKLTLRGKRLGLPLTEIRELLDIYDAAHDEGEQLTQFLATLRKRLQAQVAAADLADHRGRGCDVHDCAVELDELILTLSGGLGITVVIVTHELESIFKIVNRCIMLDKLSKTIIARGDPRKLRDESDDPRVTQFFRRETGSASA